MEIIITGHGQYATGMLSALHMVAGEKQGICAVEFLPEDSSQDYRAKLTQAMDHLGDELLIFCDLSGGTPFNQAVLTRQSYPRKRIEVVAGANLAMILEAALDGGSLSELADHVEQMGQKAILHFRQGTTSSDVRQDEGI